MSKKVNIFWFRRDLRLHDNAGFYHALKSDVPVLPVFIFDTDILDKLEDEDDARITFIRNALLDMNQELQRHGSSILVKNTTPQKAFEELLNEYDVTCVFANKDYEPYARQRDEKLYNYFKSKNIDFKAYKDQVIFEKNEIMKTNGEPYTVYTPYLRQWMDKLNDFYLKPYPTEKYLNNLYQNKSYSIPSLSSIGFKPTEITFPDQEYKDVIKAYGKTRNYPAKKNGTSRMSVHVRFGTVSIRNLAADARAATDKTWLSELVWRDFYFMILWHFPHTVNKAFKPGYDNIHWRRSESDFKAWCDGQTGYPLVDAGMRQLNATGYMHNRIRMVTASFLSKHLLIDWRLGEAYFGRKLLDYEQASNVGGWQWSVGSGNDAAPYFRVFNPELQAEKFDPQNEYIKQWVPEFDDPAKYVKPIVDHKFARERVLKEFKKALSD